MTMVTINLVGSCI